MLKRAGVVLLEPIKRVSKICGDILKESPIAITKLLFQCFQRQWMQRCFYGSAAVVARAICNRPLIIGGNDDVSDNDTPLEAEHMSKQTPEPRTELALDHTPEPEIDHPEVEVERTTGTDGNDILRGNNMLGRIDSGHGDDSIFDKTGIATINGGDGSDAISGGEGNDIIRGNNGNGELIGSTGTDQLYGGNGEDVLDGKSPTRMQSLTDGLSEDIGEELESTKAVCV